MKTNKGKLFAGVLAAAVCAGWTGQARALWTDGGHGGGVLEQLGLSAGVNGNEAMVLAETTAMPSLPAPKADLIARILEPDHALSDKERAILLGTLGEYRIEALQHLYAFGFRIVVKSEYSEFPKHWYGDTSEYYQEPKIYTRKDYLDGELWPIIRTGLKDAASMLLYRGEVPWGGPRETMMHEIGHAWDAHWKRGGEESDPKVQELYKNYLANPKSQWSSYAASKKSACEYLAEAYRMLGQSAESRKILAEKDPELYKWLRFRAAILYEVAIP